MAANYFSSPYFLAAESSLFEARDADLERPRAKLTAEKQLMLAILEDAVYCYLRFVPGASESEYRLFRDAEYWIFDAEEEWIFSFENICQLLEINATYLRSGLRARKRGVLNHRKRVKSYHSLLNFPLAAS